MDQSTDQDENKKNSKQKYIASFLVLAAVVILAFGVTFFKNKTSGDASNVSAMSDSISSNAGTTPSQTSSSSTSSYKDGTYLASGTYLSPGGNEKINVTLTIKGNTVTDSSVSQQADNRDSEEYQSQFKQNYKNYVIGKALSSISLSRVSGSSLTSGGFNNALQSIKSQAQI